MQQGSVEKRKATNGAEQDVFTGWRKVYCWTQRPGATAWWKRNARRRERREYKKSYYTYE